MKKIVLILVVIMWSCNRQPDLIPKKQNYIDNPGMYYVGNNRLFIREFTGGTLTFGIVDSKSKILYQANSFTPFSKYQKWAFYIDSLDNIWFYNNDFQEYAELIKDSLGNVYSYKKLENGVEDFPLEFKKYLKEN